MMLLSRVSKIRSSCPPLAAMHLLSLQWQRRHHLSPPIGALPYFLIWPVFPHFQYSNVVWAWIDFYSATLTCFWNSDSSFCRGFYAYSSRVKLSLMRPNQSLSFASLHQGCDLAHPWTPVWNSQPNCSLPPS